MPALGQKRTLRPALVMSATPQERQNRGQVGLFAKCDKPDIGRTYSITSSARVSKVGGTVSPSVLAVLRLITSSYLVGACTGRLAGFSPLRMRST